MTFWFRKLRETLYYHLGFSEERPTYIIPQEEKAKAVTQFLILSQKQQAVLDRFFFDPTWAETYVKCFCYVLFEEKIPSSNTIFKRVSEFNTAFNTTVNSHSFQRLFEYQNLLSRYWHDDYKLERAKCLFVAIRGGFSPAASKSVVEYIVDQPHQFCKIIDSLYRFVSTDEMDQLVTKAIAKIKDLAQECPEQETTLHHLLGDIMLLCHKLSDRSLAAICDLFWKSMDVRNNEAIITACSALLNHSAANHNRICDYLASVFAKSMANGRPTHVFGKAMVHYTKQYVANGDLFDAIEKAVLHIADADPESADEDLLSDFALVALYYRTFVSRKSIPFINDNEDPGLGIEKAILPFIETKNLCYPLAVDILRSLYLTSDLDTTMLDHLKYREPALALLESDGPLSASAEELLAIMPLQAILLSKGKEAKYRLDRAVKKDAIKGIVGFKLSLSTDELENEAKLLESFREVYTNVFCSTRDVSEKWLKQLKFEVLNHCHYMGKITYDATDPDAVDIVINRQRPTEAEADQVRKMVGTMSKRIIPQHTILSAKEMALILCLADDILLSDCCYIDAMGIKHRISEAELAVFLDHSELGCPTSIGPYLILQWFSLLIHYAKPKTVLSFYKRFSIILNRPGFFSYSTLVSGGEYAFYRLLSTPSRLERAMYEALRRGREDIVKCFITPATRPKEVNDRLFRQLSDLWESYRLGESFSKRISRYQPISLNDHNIDIFDTVSNKEEREKSAIANQFIQYYDDHTILDRFVCFRGDSKYEGILELGYALDLAVAIDVVEILGESALEHLPQQMKHDPIIQMIIDL